MRTTTALAVLVVDDELSLRMGVERRCRELGFFVEVASTFNLALERLRDTHFDVVVCDPALTQPTSKVTLVEWLASHRPSTRIVALGGTASELLRQRYAQAGVVFLTTPIDFDALTEVLTAIAPRRGLYGLAIEVELFDYVQMVSLGGRDKRIEISTERGLGHIWFEHGDICHVEFDGLEGERAFFRLLELNRGAFREIIFEQPPHRTVVGSSMHLLMEAARRIDEGILGQALDPAEAPLEAAPARPLDARAAESAADPAETLGDEEFDLEADDAAGADASMSASPIPAVSSGSALKRFVNDPSAGRSGVRSRPHVAAALPDQELEELEAMLEPLLEYDGVTGAALISSTGKLLVDRLADSTSVVSLAGFYTRGAARIGRALGYHVYDSILVSSQTGTQLLVIPMGSTSLVLSVANGVELEPLRNSILGSEA